MALSPQKLCMDLMAGNGLFVLYTYLHVFFSFFRFWTDCVDFYFYGLVRVVKIFFLSIFGVRCGSCADLHALYTNIYWLLYGKSWRSVELILNINLVGRLTRLVFFRYVIGFMVLGKTLLT